MGDLDLDGFQDLVVATRDGYLFAWRTRGAAWGEVQWPTFHHDNRGTGNFHTPLPQILPPELDLDCACATGGLPPATPALLLLLLPLLRRRRTTR
jgi:uncharacterized protein (TIGR03382 family)